MRAAEDVEPLLPGLRLVEPSERDTLRDVVSSDSFYTRLADLRGVTRAITERVVRTYREQLAAYGADLGATRDRLEALVDWPRLQEEDREEIADRLRHPLPSSAPDGQEMACLRELLMRRATLPRLERDLEQEVEKRRPRIEVHDGNGTEPVDFDLLSVVKPTVISGPDDLAVWIDEVRAGLENALKAGAPIRIRVGGR